jgi:hypothetical protein
VSALRSRPGDVVLPCLRVDSMTPDDLYDERSDARYDGPDDREREERERYEALSMFADGLSCADPESAS